MKTKKPAYTVSISVNGRDYSGSGPTIEKALDKIKITGKMVTKAVVKVLYDGKTFERMVRVPLVRKLFSENQTTRTIVLKSFKILFGL